MSCMCGLYLIDRNNLVNASVTYSATIVWSAGCMIMIMFHSINIFIDEFGTMYSQLSFTISGFNSIDEAVGIMMANNQEFYNCKIFQN